MISHKTFLILALLLFVFGLCAVYLIGISSLSLFFLGILSGLIYSFTNANDQRVMKGRLCIKEKEHLKAQDYIAITGSITAVFTWPVLFIVYYGFKNLLSYEGNIGSDMVKIFTSKMFIIGIPIPLPFIFAGIFTVLSTWIYLEFIKRETLGYYALLGGVLVTIIDSLFGRFYFHDPVTHEEGLLYFFGIIIIIIYVLFKKKTPSNKKMLPLFLGLIFTLFLVDFIIRDVTSAFGNEERFFVSLIFRALYFSVFLIYGAYWFLGYYKRRVEEKREIMGKFKENIGLISVSVITIMLTFFLKTPVIAYNLIAGPFSFLIGNYMMLQIIGYIYGTEGENENTISRLKNGLLGRNIILTTLSVILIIIFIGLSIIKFKGG